MSVVHFLNVLEGDCNLIQHDTGRVTLIDVSNAYDQNDTEAEKQAKKYKDQIEKERRAVPRDKTDFEQKKFPDNPIEYLKSRGITDIFRFIISHPDMDHLDGIHDLYSSFRIAHTWDTDNKKKCDTSVPGFGGYNPEDWDYYTKIRAGEVKTTKRLTLFAGQQADYWQPDNLHILAPTKELVASAIDCDDYNDSSYVVLFTPPKQNGKTWKILFAGDSHDKTWEYILKNYKAAVADIDILFAPHHGRDSDRSYDFLNVLRPKVTLFGNAKTKDLAYNSYPRIRITNNQAGHVIMDISETHIRILVKNKEFANWFRSRKDRNLGIAPYVAGYQAYELGYLNAN
jgi:competence protein ComEC